MSKKTSEIKGMLVKAQRMTRAVPIFVRIKTARKVSSSPKRRNWRSGRLKLRSGKLKLVE